MASEVAQGEAKKVLVNIRTKSADLESEYTDFGNARRMLKMHAGNILFDVDRGKWVVWDNKKGKWNVDDGAVRELVKEMIRKIKIEAMDAYAAAENAEDDDERKQLQTRGKALIKWWMASQNPSTIGDCLRVLSTDKKIATTTSDFDTNKNLFNFRNGTLNLETMDFYPHKKDDHITQSCGHDYDSAAKCPKWDEFVERIFLNHAEKKELMAYLQCALGMSLSGDTSEQKVFMPVGGGGNGKSVMAETMKIVFGDYAKSIAASSLTTASQNKIRNDLARLTGCRIAFASELPPDAHLDDQLIKNLSGGDEITVRFLFKEEFQFKPELKLWWSFNKTPATRDMSKGLWDRVRTIPFNERIRGTSDDIKMEILLQQYQQEISGIINWLIQGYVYHRKNGKLPICNAVMERTEEYREESDPLHSFSEEYLDIWVSQEHLNLPPYSEYELKASCAFNAYQWHAFRDGVKRPMTGTKFGIVMKEKFGRANFVKRSDAYYYLGIKLKKGKHNLPEFDDRFHNYS